MKKHSFQEHYDDFERWLASPNSPESMMYGSFDGSQQRTLMIVYERWLNDRELFSVENAQPDDHWFDETTGIWREGPRPDALAG